MDDSLPLAPKRRSLVAYRDGMRFMLRAAGCAIALHAFTLSAEEPKPVSAKSMLNGVLTAEENCELGDPRKAPVEQVKDAAQRFYRYRDQWCDDEEDLKKTKACMEKVFKRIIDRAKRQLMKAEGRLERIKDSPGNR